ncbi:MAG: hypothetical protein IRY94_21165 [Rhodospirillaceae bacterium]|nr:hypothetical protein [Rhodospirillaceae bacterium]
MRRVLLILLIVVVLAIVGGAAVLATWDMPAPTTTMHKEIPNERFGR